MSSLVLGKEPEEKFPSFTTINSLCTAMPRGTEGFSEKFPAATDATAVPCPEKSCVFTMVCLEVGTERSASLISVCV